MIWMALSSRKHTNGGVGNSVLSRPTVLQLAQAQLSSLRDGFRLLLPDLPFHGNGDADGGYYRGRSVKLPRRLDG